MINITLSFYFFQPFPFTQVILEGLTQGWPEKDQSNQDFSEVNINKCLIFKKINEIMVYLC